MSDRAARVEGDGLCLDGDKDAGGGDVGTLLVSDG